MHSKCGWCQCGVLVLYCTCVLQLALVQLAACSDISWATEPVFPDQSVMFQAHALTADAVVEMRSLGSNDWVTTDINGITDHGAASVIPASFPIGIVEMRVDGGTPYMLNAPRPWYLFGDAGNSSTPDGWLRVFGTSIFLCNETLLPTAAAEDDAERAIVIKTLMLLIKRLSSAAVGTTSAMAMASEAERLLHSLSLSTLYELADAFHTLISTEQLLQWLVNHAQESLASASTSQAVLPSLMLIASVNGSGNATYQLTASTFKLNQYHAWFDLTGVAAGSYDVFVSSNANGMVYWQPLCTFLSPQQPCAAQWTVAERAPTVDTVFNVMEFGAVQPGAGTNCTLAVLKAMEAARENGGGILYFPRGTYFITGPLVLPPYTSILGEATHLVSLYFAEQNTTTAPPAYITTNTTTPWSIHNVTVYVTAYFNNVIQVQPYSDGFHMSHVRIRADSYFCLSDFNITDRGRVATWDWSLGAAVLIAGRNVFVVDNDIFSSGDDVSSLWSGDTGPEYVMVARNKMWNGRISNWGIQWKQGIYEDNDITGISIMAGGANWAEYSPGDNDPHVQHIYDANNTHQHVWGWDREIMTMDGGYGVYYGGIKHFFPNQVQFNLSTAAETSQNGGAFCVIAGKGTGQCRRVVNSSSDYVTWTVDRPFTIALDSSSNVTIMPYSGRMILHGNRYTDGGAVQTYATAIEVIITKCNFTRTGGLIAWGLQESSDSAWNVNLMVQFVGNTVLEGNHVWNYFTTPYDNVHYALEPFFIGSLTGAQFETSKFQGALNRFIVFRGNSIMNNGGIVVSGSSANVLVEDTLIMDSDVSIQVNYTTVQGGIVVRNNLIVM